MPPTAAPACAPSDPPIAPPTTPPTTAPAPSATIVNSPLLALTAASSPPSPSPRSPSSRAVWKASTATLPIASAVGVVSASSTMSWYMSRTSRKATSSRLSSPWACANITSRMRLRRSASRAVIRWSPRSRLSPRFVACSASPLARSNARRASRTKAP
jgi:hypothetical protein